MSEWQFPLKRGSSPDPKQGACLLDAVSWIEYGHLGDHPRCVDEELAAYGRALNDWLPQRHRQRLRRFIPLLAGTRRSMDLAYLDLVLERRHLIRRRAMEIATAAGLKLRRGRAQLSPIEGYERALQCCTWSHRDELIYTPAIELLGEAIALGQRAAPPPADHQVADGVQRFRLARAA